MKKEIMKLVQEYKYTLFTCFISIFILTILFLSKQIFPYGTNDFIKIDFFHQYYPMSIEYISKLCSFENLLYSFNTGLGLPFFRNLFNYLSSPFTLILCLFKAKNFANAFTLIIGAKVIISTITMNFFLNKQIKKSLLSIPISLFYGFCSYFIAYHWNIMWTDGMIFLPLIVMGIECLINKKKYFLYSISLGLAIISNYYIGYTLCIFSGLYFLFYYFLKNNFNIKHFTKSFGHFLLISLTTVGILSCILIPMYYSLQTISATKDVAPTIFEVEFSILDFIFNVFSGVIPTDLVSKNNPLPNVSTSILTFILIPLYFLNNRIEKKQKVLHFILLIVMFLSMFISIINFTWHGFHFPNDLPYRQSYIFIFVTLLIAYKSLLSIKNISFLKLISSFALFLIILVAAKLTDFENMTNICFIFNFALILLYLIVFVVNRKWEVKNFTIPILLIIICSFEMCYVCYTNLEVDKTKESLNSVYNRSEYLVKNLMPSEQEFYRIEESELITFNDGALSGYYGVSIFSSMEYQNIAEFQKNMGMAGNNINSYYYKWQTTIYNTIFGIKYIIGSLPESKNYDNIYNSVYKYKYPLSLSFAVNSDIKNWELSHNPFMNQNNFISMSTSIDNALIPLEYSVFDDNNSVVAESEENYYTIDTDHLNFTINNTVNGEVYLYVDSSDIESILIDENYYFISINEPYIVNIGEYEGGESIKGTLFFADAHNDYVGFYAYASEYSKIEGIYNALSEEQMQIKSFSDANIEGTITVNNDKSIFTSIAYDEGWKVLVDGKEVNTYKIGNAYMGFDIEKGTHTIQYLFFPKGLKIGIIVTTLSIILATFSIIINKKKH